MPRRFFRWILFAPLVLGAARSASAQEAAPSAPSATLPAVEAEDTADPENQAQIEAAKAELQALEAKAVNGDLEAALELGDKLVSYRNAGVAVPFYRQAAKGGVIEAQEKLGLLLLGSGDRTNWPEGHSWLGRAVQAGSVRAIEELARILLNGSHDREQSLPEAQALLDRARTMPGAKEAHFLLGKMAAEGIGRARDGAAAVAHLRRGEEAGSIDAMLGLVDLLVTDAVVKKDLPEAQRLAKKAYQLGSGEAAYRLALMFERADPKKPDLPSAREWLEKARERGHAGATARMGTYALQGMGETVDPAKAYALYREAAARGHSDAAYAVAKLYDEGQGVPADPVAAAAWYRIAAESGQAQAQNEYGVRLVSGQGVRSDPKAAARWFESACLQNLPAAFVNLGELYLAGTGVSVDEAEAYRLFESAAKAGYLGAQQRLANLCQQGVGLGGVADPVGAAYWAARAAAQDERLKESAEKMRGALTKAQVADLEKRLSAGR